MNIPSICSRPTPIGDRPMFMRRVNVLALLVFGLSSSGCGFGGGQLLYGLGFGKVPKVPAEFQLTQNPVLILVDDDSGSVKSPSAKRVIADELAQELLRTGSAKRIVPQETLDGLRQTVPNFEKRGCREVGEMAGAEQVLWLQIQGYFADEQFSDAADAAFVQVTVKVINVLEKEHRSRVRLWPTSSQGTPVTASLSGDKVVRLQTTDAVSAELARKLATDIARLFHEYQPGDTERR